MEKILSFLCEEGQRIVSLSCDNSSGKLEAVDLPELGEFCVLAQESKSTEFGIVVSVQPLCTAGLPKLCSQQPGSGCPRCMCTRAKSSLPCLLPHHPPHPASLLGSSHEGGTRCAAEEMCGQGARGIYWDFQSCYSDWASCLLGYSIQPAWKEALVLCYRPVVLTKVSLLHPCLLHCSS